MSFRSVRLLATTVGVNGVNNFLAGEHNESLTRIMRMPTSRIALATPSLQPRRVDNLLTRKHDKPLSVMIS